MFPWRTDSHIRNCKLGESRLRRRQDPVPTTGADGSSATKPRTPQTKDAPAKHTVPQAAKPQGFRPIGRGSWINTVAGLPYFARSPSTEYSIRLSTQYRIRNTQSSSLRGCQVLLRWRNRWDYVSITTSEATLKNKIKSCQYAITLRGNWISSRKKKIKKHKLSFTKRLDSVCLIGAAEGYLLLLANVWNLHLNGASLSFLLSAES